MLSSLVALNKSRKRVGRGGSRGGNSGKGGKGQTQRSGPGLGLLFEGGQSPLPRRLPKRGFNNKRFETVYDVINVERLNDIFETGALITKKELVEQGLIKNQSVLVKILGNGLLSKKFVIHADAWSKTAQEAIQKNGGEVHLIKEM